MHRFAKHVGENLAPTMLRCNPKQTEFVDFLSPFGNKLRADNRWVKLASLMPWAVVEECYAESLAGTGMKLELVAFFEVLFKQIASKVVFKISPNQMGVIGVVLSVHVFD